MKRSKGRIRVQRAVLLGALCVLQAAVASAAIHTWDVKEVFSNSDGTIQFVELWEANGTAGETGVGNGTIHSTSLAHSHPFGNGAVAPPTSNKHYLIGTPAFAVLFAALPGAPAPDEVLPANRVPFFNIAGDTVTFQAQDSFAFGAVPTNGTDSLTKGVGVALNSPTNYAGATGSVNANPPAVPVAPPAALLMTLGLLMAGGVGGLLWYRQQAAH